jgi:Aspartyl protease
MMVLCTLLGNGGAAAAVGPVTVPVDLIDNYPIISADIDGRKVRLMFDLGEDSALVLTRATLEELKIAPTGAGHIVADVKGNAIESPTFSLPHLRIGGASFTNVFGRIDAHDPSYQSTHVGQQGYIGPSLLGTYQIVLDYRAGKMTLIPPGTRHIQRAGCRGAAVPFLPEWNGAPVTKAQTDFGDLTLVWDTGAPVSIIRKARIEETHAKVANQLIHTEHFFLNDTDFGPLEFRPLEFLQPPGSDGFIGTNFFAQHVVCVDLPGKRFLIRQ